MRAGSGIRAMRSSAARRRARTAATERTGARGENVQPRRRLADTALMAIDQRPVELILARGLMSNLTTPAFLVDTHGTLVFFNDAAGELLGLRYEEAGPMPLPEWGTRFIPLDDQGLQIPV